MEGVDEAKRARQLPRLPKNTPRANTPTTCVASRSRCRPRPNRCRAPNMPRVALPKTQDDGELYAFITEGKRPGHFPYTAGVFPFKRTDELSARMFAGEGEPERTNRRFHYLPGPRLRPPFHRVRLGHPLRTKTPLAAPTSGARSATRASPSPRPTTPSASIPALTCATPTPRSR